MKGKRTLWELLFLVAVILLLTVPFLNQAYQLDDREFIEFGRAQLEHPFQFYLTDYDYAGAFYKLFQTTHPPVLSSLIATTIWLTGNEAEPLLHGAYLIFPLLAGVSMYSLGRRFTGRALAASLLLVTTTGFLVTSHTLMGDLPGLAMWLASISSYVWGVDRVDRRLLVLSAFFLSLAVMTSYQCLSLLPLLFLYTLLKRRITVANMVPLLVPLAVFAVYATYFYSSTGEFIRFSYRRGIRFGWDAMPLKARALIVFLGASTIFPLSIIMVMVRKRLDILLMGVLFVPLALIGVWIPFSSGDLDSLQAVLILIFSAAGLSVFIVAVRNIVIGLSQWKTANCRTVDRLFLSIWFIGVSFYIFFLLPYTTVRYMMPLFPPVIFLFLQGAEAMLQGRRRWLTGFLSGTIILTLAMALPGAVATYKLASANRTLADQYRNEFSDEVANVWFQGEFGFRYYMEKAGFDYLGVSAIAESGDLVISSIASSTTGQDRLLAPVPKEFSIVIGKKIINDDFPFRTSQYLGKDGFYTRKNGPLPVMPSREPLDEITIYRLQW